MQYIFILFGVLFVGLKLTGHIDWSWFWVTAPFWGAALGAIGAMITAIAIYYLMNTND